MSSSTTRLSVADAAAEENAIGDYRLGKILGQGTFGTVSAAEHVHSGELVAVKAIPDGKMDRVALDREIRNHRRLDHPNIVKVRDVIETNGTVFIVMEHASSELFDLIVGSGRLKEEEAGRLFLQIVAAVEHCHDRGIVHRDLKPENILLDCSNNVKLVDFGFSCEWKVGEFLTDSVGSPNYAAPELLRRGCQYQGPEVDIWSCGVILYALLCNQLPFDADNYPDLFKLIRNGNYKIPGYVSNDARDLIGEILQVDPNKRLTLAEMQQHRWLAKVREQARADKCAVSSADVHTLGDYRLGRTVGQGTFGIVKSAENIHTGEHVAVKVIPEGKMDRNALEREITNQRCLNHPNIIKVYDVVDADGQTSIFMEHAPSELFDYIVASGRLQEQEARRLFLQIVAAVEHCHVNMVVHRDLKPENILLDSDNNVKLIDFGFSSVWRTGEFLTDSCGSPNYAAPELLRKNCKYEGPEVDVWSCGVILFALLTNQLPFDADNVPDLFRLIKKGQYKLPGYISPDARDLIAQMLQVDPKKRFSLADVRSHIWLMTDTTEPVQHAELPKALTPLVRVRSQPSKLLQQPLPVKSVQSMLQLAVNIGLSVQA